MSKVLKAYRKRKGFTLLELMIVMGIMGALSAIAFAAVAGVKGTSVETQAKNDGANTQKAADRFSNQAIKTGIFPEKALSSSKYAGQLTSYAYKDQQGNAITFGSSSAASPQAADHTALDWDKSVAVWLQNGEVENMNFVPNFLMVEPESTNLKSVVDNNIYEFLWLLKKNETKSEVSRAVEVYRLVQDDSATYYKRIYGGKVRTGYGS